MRNLLVLDPINGASLSYRTAVTGRFSFYTLLDKTYSVAIWPDMRNSPSTHQNMTLTGGSQRPQSQPVYVVRDRHRNTKRPASWTFVDTSSEKIVKTPKFDTVAVESTPHEVSQDRSRSIPSVTVSSDSTGPSSLHQKDAPSVVELSHTSERPARTATVQERPFPPESNLRATPEDQNQVGVVTRNALRRARSKNYRGR